MYVYCYRHNGRKDVNIIELGLGNNSIYCIHRALAIIVSHDFGLPILSQWQNIVLLQFNDSYNI